MIDVGRDFRTLRSIKADPLHDPSAYGTHRGGSVGFNLRHVRPGWTYYWQLDGDHIERFRGLGWKVITQDDPEQKFGEESLAYGHSIDNRIRRGRYVLMGIPNELYRKNVQEPRARAAKAALEGATEGYLSKGDILEKRYGSGADGPVLFRASGHGRHGYRRE